jgi:glutamate dehydrogenase
MADGRLTLETRNPLLASMTDDVAKLVLRNNYLQSLALSLTEARGPADIADEMRLMQALERDGRLDRKVEQLPDDMALAESERQGRGLTRPELAVLLAYAKLAFHDAVLESGVPDDPYFAVELRRYFPDGVRVGYPDAVDGHRLRREIIATGLANAVINRTGPAMANRMAEETGRPLADVARAYALTRDAFGVLDVNSAIDALDAKIGGGLQLALYAAVQQFTLDRMAWFMRHVDFSAGLEPLVKRFGGKPEKADPAGWVARGAPAEIAAMIAALLASASRPDAVLVAELAGVDGARAAETFGALGRRLRAGDVKAAAGVIHPVDSAERQALLRLSDGIDASLRRLAVQALAAGGAEAWAAGRAAELARTDRTVADMLMGTPSLARVSVAAAAIGDLAA